jgi:hypothetical protein
MALNPCLNGKLVPSQQLTDQSAKYEFARLRNMFDIKKSFRDLPAGGAA